MQAANPSRAWRLWMGSFAAACCGLLLLLLLLLLGQTAARANDFPTLERVVFVQECMRAHPGPAFEMNSKCACTLDALALQLSYDDFVTLNTISKASTIAGERGGTIRDAPELARQLKRWRALQSQAEQGCFITTSTR
jgi:hypothetical protein